MARATGSINYLEHRTPLKDESGKYQIHPDVRKTGYR